MTKLQERLQRRDATAIGPCYVGLILTPEVEDEAGGRHSVVFLPDKNNPLLRDAGLPLHFYYLPTKPRLDTFSDGTFIFGLQRFSGIMDPAKNIGESGYSELAGGVMNFTATLAPPKGVIDKAFEKLKEMLPKQSNGHYFWKKDSVQPVLMGPIPLRSNETVMHSLTFERDATAPAPGFVDNPDAWAFQIQGDGAGALNVQASNAFTVMLGRRPIELLWTSAKTGTSQVTLENHISYDVWSLVSEISIKGDWEKVRKHFSAEASGGVSWFRANASHEVNSLIESGAVEVDIKFGAGVVDMERKQQIETAADAIADKIYALVESKLKEAGSSIGKEMDSAKAPKTANKLVNLFKKNFMLGISVGVKNRKDVFSGTFEFTKKVHEQVVRSEVLSSQMEGLFDETKDNEEALERYFSEVFMEEGFRKIHVITSAIANWPENQLGDPIHSLKIQIGYPDSQGQINWKPTARVLVDANDVELSSTTVPAIWTPANKNARFVFDFTRHDNLGDAAEKIWVRRTIAFKESPDVAVNEVTDVFETTTHIIDVRAESSGQLLVGPISLDMTIPEEDKQIDVLVHIKTNRFGEKIYRFNAKSLDSERYYKVWYAAPEDLEGFSYKVEATVKGKRFGQKSVHWESRWQNGSGNGPLTVEIPEPPDDLGEKLDEYLS